PAQVFLFRRSVGRREGGRGPDHAGFREFRIAVHAFRGLGRVDGIADRTEHSLHGPGEGLFAAGARLCVGLGLGSAFATVGGVAGGEGALGHACLLEDALGLRVAHSYVLYERISEMCFLPAGGAYAAGMPRGVNPTTRASAGIFRKDFTFSSLKAKIQEVPNPSLVAATVTFARAMPRSRGYEFMYPPIIATASSSRAHATTTRGASAMCFAFVQAPASFRFVSSSETTMNFHGCKLSAEFANRAAFITAWTFCCGTGSGLYLLTLFTDLMASRASMSSQTVRFGVVIISVSGQLFRRGERFVVEVGEPEGLHELGIRAVRGDRSSRFITFVGVGGPEFTLVGA